MKVTGSRVFVGAVAAIIFLALAGLEFVSQRSRVDQPPSVISGLGDAPRDRWQDSLITQEDRLTLQRGPTAGWSPPPDVQRAAASTTEASYE